MAGRGALELSASKGVLIMVAQIKAEVFQQTLCTPVRDPFDSEGVQLAVETARGLEGEGDFAGAARWLWRAVRETVRQGNVARAEQLARAVEELAEKADLGEEGIFVPSSAPISNAMGDHCMPVVRSQLAAASFAESPAPRSELSGARPAPPVTGSIPPLLAALISSMPPFGTRASAEIPPPAATPSQCPATESRPQAAPESAANDNIDDGWPVEPTESMVVAKPAHAVDASVAQVAPASHSASQCLSRVLAFRAAIPASGQHTNSFFIQRLASGQRAPAGMVEAMIVVTGESETTTSFEMSLGVAKDTASDA
jgi:hypothetical protein